MESYASVASRLTGSRNPSPQPESKAKRSQSKTDTQGSPSFADAPSANDGSPMVTNPQQAIQEPVLTAELPVTNSGHKDETRHRIDYGPAVPGPTGNEEFSDDTSLYSDDEISGGATLWCTVTKRNHGELLAWGASRCPACCQRVKKPKPQLVSQVSETQGADTEDPTTRRQAQFRYSNKFLWRNGMHFFSEPWPDLLDLDRDRGKLAMAQGSTDEPVLEIVTIVATNLIPNSTSRQSANWVFSNSSLGTKCVGKEVIIHSRRVMDVLQTLITYYPNLELGGPSLSISQPYALFYHHLDEIEKFQNTYSQPREDEPGDGPTNPASKHAHLRACDEETYKHLEIIREVIERENLSEVLAEKARHRQRPAVATYSMLWLLFKPGTKVYVRRLGSPVFVGVVLSIQGGDLSPGRPEPFSIDYWTLRFDGTRLGRWPDDFVIKPFTGEKRISELEVSPCSLYDRQDPYDLHGTLLRRGVKYWTYLPGVQVDYRGKLPIDHSEWQGRVMFDPITYYRYAYSDSDQPHPYRDPAMILPTVGNIQDSGFRLQPPDPDMSPYIPPMGWPVDPNPLPNPSRKWQSQGPPRNESGPWADYDNLIPGSGTQSLELVDDMTGETDMSRYLMCPPDVIGFDLKARQWQLFDVACCHDVDFNNKAIDSLVMKEETKLVIRSLVNRYTAVDAAAGGSTAPKPWTADFIKNKGEGQIFLLHGSPGVGKTYTSECIAEETCRPLLSLTCGDIGTNEVMAERTLSKWFQFAEIWGAVMLLDEADVFLEKRSISDLQRNSLVSVFLRIVEYYRGILFLTTNRVGQFDDAFISRIHTVIHFENFSRQKQGQIWDKFFEKLKEERWRDIRIDYSAKTYVSRSEDLRKIEWNGRQIRNAFQTAVAFAEYRFQKLKPEEQKERGKASLEDQDFAKVCEMTIAFQRYMNSIHSGDESKRAKLERNRDDTFSDASMSPLSPRRDGTGSLA